MEKLIIVRHGDETNGDLNERGRDEIAKLSKKLLKDHLNTEGKKRILSSTAPRALQSAMILRAVTGVGIEDHEILWSDDRHPAKTTKLLALLEEVFDEFDIVIMVTHLEYTFELPPAFMSYFLHHKVCAGKEVSRGHAIVIDCTKKTITQIAA